MAADQKEKVVLSDDSINSYGYRVLTSGIDLARFRKNPVMLYDHRSYSLPPIGKWEDIDTSEGQLSAVPVFDLEDEESARYAGKFSRGYLNAFSIGFRVLATSDAPEDMEPGQKYPTITKSELFEVSMTPLPSNANAVRLYDASGRKIDQTNTDELRQCLSALSNSPTPMSDIADQKPDVTPDEREKFLAALMRKLGLKPEDSSPKDEQTEQSVAERLATLKLEYEAQIEALSTEKDDLVAKNEELQKEYDAKLEELRNEVKRLADMPSTTPAPAPAQDAPATTPNEDFLTDADLALRQKWEAKKALSTTNNR